MDDMDWMDEDDNLDTDFNSLKQKHIVHGFREGLSEGQDQSLQYAFNVGFTKSAILFEKMSKYRGMISALYMFLINTPQYTGEIGKKIEALITKLEDFENDEKHLEEISIEQEEETTCCKVILHKSNEKVGENSVDSLVDCFGKLDNANENSNQCCKENTAQENKSVFSKESNCEVKTPINSTQSQETINTNCDTNESLRKKSEHLEKLVKDHMADIISSFDEYTKNKVQGCFTFF